jgi:hypothetical protein
MAVAPDDPAVALARWRADHPQAPLAEIEAAVDAQLSAYRVVRIMATATASPPVDRPGCPACAMRMPQVGIRARLLRTAHEGRLTLHGVGVALSDLETGRFPLSERLALVPGMLSPALTARPGPFDSELVGGEWGEVRMLTVGRVARIEASTTTTALSYASHLADAAIYA